MKNTFLVIAFFFVCSIVSAQAALPAKELISEAIAKAKRENKKVFVKFTASWCVWCKRMDAAMHDSSCKKFFEDNFVIVQLDADERSDKKNLENSGAAAYRIKYNGDENQGIPFWFILDKNETLLADCYIRERGKPLTERGKNMACPATMEEVAAFIEVLKTTTSLKENELKIISERFRQNDVRGQQ